VLTQLRSLGYVTLDAGNAAEALAIVDADGNSICSSPTSSCRNDERRQLADAILKQRPDLRILSPQATPKTHHSSRRLDSGVLCSPSRTANRISPE